MPSQRQAGHGTRPLTPGYNTCVEAGSGSLKPRIFHQADSHGGNWTSDDVEAAGSQLNAALRLWGPLGLRPLERREAIRRGLQQLGRNPAGGP